MNRPHFKFWPKRLPHTINPPATSLWHNLAVNALRFPDKPALVFFDRVLTYAEVMRQAERLAATLAGMGVKKGDRVVLYMQNSPQWVIAHFAILRANAVVVPVNPMNRAEELKHYILDPDVKVAIAAADIAGELARADAQLAPEERLTHLISAHYSDAFDFAASEQSGTLPGAWRDWLGTRHALPVLQNGSVVDWLEALQGDLKDLPEHTAVSGDMAVLPYTSGTTGLPKGCIHTHASIMHNAVGSALWGSSTFENVVLSVVPMFHITGMVSVMHAAIYGGATLVIMPRWERELAGRLISRWRVTHWTNIPTMVIDLMASPNFSAGPPQGKDGPLGGQGATQSEQPWGAPFSAGPPQGKDGPLGGQGATQSEQPWGTPFSAGPPQGKDGPLGGQGATQSEQPWEPSTTFDLSGLLYIGGGGAAMPQAVAQRLLEQYGLSYAEGYGLTETAAPSHSNPPDATKQQCLGVPFLNVDARVIDPITLTDMPQGEQGEIIMCGPQNFKGYWKRPDATAAAFIEIDGKSFFRSGDLGRVDEDGYFFITDRLKRMINASGFKVWPAEVEALMFRHPAIQEACIISTSDAYRGESVKAVVVLRAGFEGKVSEQEIIDWCKDNMAAYKYPRVVQFVDALPKSGSGKVMWRSLQEAESAKN